ncbi:MAG: alpha-amylase family glycosyl hydrolase [Paludibacter sp.]|nr:alpha-amylase family glycosyl hydrolase [Paludibacter sp.]
MKKSTLTMLVLLVSTFVWGQIVTTTPTIITDDYTGTIEVVFDATKGTAGLKDFTGNVYAHTGVFTETSPSTWAHAPVWGDNAAKYKLTSLGANKWKLLITPNMAGYYGLNAGEKVTKLCFVFRSEDKTKEGKDTGGADIFVPVYKAGLNVTFTNPTANQTVAVGSVVDFSVASSVAANLNLLINNTSVKTANSATTLSYSHTFSTANDYTVVASATVGAMTVYDTVKISVPLPVTVEPRPAGVKNGINYIDNSTVTLVLYAPGKSNVFVIGEFNDWAQLNEYQMKKDGDYWWITLSGLTPGKMYAYQYFVDGSIKISDPYTELVLDPWNDKWINEHYTIYPGLKAYPEGKTEGLVATFQTAKPAYNWEVPNFSTPKRENMVIYELLLRDFTVERSLEAAIAKLDYLKTLGITAVELMPIQEFDGNNSWGYNPNHYFAPDKAYGSPEMYKKFIDECHKRGMAVILDIVLNHATGIHPYAKLWWNSSTSKTSTQNPYFNVDAPHPYSVFHDFNHTYAGTKDMFKRMVQYWITEYKVDGYRLDLTKGFTQTSSTEATASNYDQSRIDNITEYYNAAKAVKSDVMFILEHFCADNEETQLAYKGMYLWRNVNNAYSQSAMGYQSSSDFSRMNAGPRNWVGYAESHDEERNFFKAKAFGTGNLMTDSLARVARVPLNIAFTTLIPGPKMIWQFGEMGYDYSIDSNGGRVDAKPSAWSYLNIAHRKAAYDASSKIISLRRLYPDAFTTGAFSLQIAEADWNAGRRIALTHADLNMVVLGNFRTDAGISANPTFQKTGTWYELLSGETLQVTNTTMAIDIPTGGLKIYTDRKIIFNTAVDELEVNTDCEVYPTTTEGRLFIATDSELKAVKIYDLQGALQMHLSNKKEIDIDQLNNGLYLMEVTTNKAKSVHKIIKK